MNYGSVGVEGGEHFVDLNSGVLLSDFGSGQSQELREVDAA